MTTRSWIRTCFPRTPRTAGNDRARYRPRLEALEDRLTPAGGPTSSSLGSLPVDAQAVVSATLGQGDPTYAGRSAGGGGFTLSNAAQHFNALLTPTEAMLSLGSDTWSLELARIGHGDTTATVGSATVQGQQNRVTYDYGSVTQWFVNGPAGLEQGFTLSQDPVGSDGTAALLVDLQLGGSVHATVNAAGDGLTLSRSDGSTVWTYSGLTVFDAAERSLPTSLAVRSSGGHDDLLIQVDDLGAQYPLTIDPLVQEAKLTASDGVAGDSLGAAVAISSDGTTVVAGAPDATGAQNSGPGAVYVFEKPVTGWANATEIAKLTASDGASGDLLGAAVAISSDDTTVVAGAPFATIGGNEFQGAAYVFVKPDTGWSTTTQTAKLTASDGALNAEFGAAVAISSDGTTVVAGAPFATMVGNESQGVVYVFVKPGSTWVTNTQTARLIASDGAGDQLGASVAISGDGTTVVAGAPQVTTGASTAHGAVYVFVEPSTSWVGPLPHQHPTITQFAKLTASDGADGDQLGALVAISSDGTTVVAGAPDATIGGNGFQGAAYVFVKQGTWGTTTQTAKLTSSDGAYNDRFGFSVAINGDGSRVVAAAIFATIGDNQFQGAVYLFEESNTGWTTTTQTAKATASDGAAEDQLGASVAISGDASTVAAGAPGPGGGAINLLGALYVFVNLAASTTTVSDAGGTYNGSAFPATGLVSGAGGLNTTPSSFSYVGTGSTSYGPTASAPINAGSYAVTATYIGDANHAGSMATTPFTISPKTLTITADADANAANGQTAFSKTYGSTLTFAGTEFTTSGLVNRDTVTSVALSSLGAAAGATVAGSPYTVSIGTAMGSGLSNYTLIYDPGTLTVTLATLTITATNESKTYGTTFTPNDTNQFTTSGLVNNDSVTSVILSSNGYAATAGVTNSPYPITPSAATGSGLGNYIINYFPGTLTIAQDGTTTTGSLSAASLSFGQTLTVTATVTAKAPGSGTPTGMVDFYDNTTATDLGSVTLSSGMASVNRADLPVGTTTLTLSYLGDSNFLPSSTTVTATIAPSILVLHATASGALSLSGNATISLAGNVVVDSNSASALTASGNAVLRAASIQVVGKVQKSGNATLSPAPLTGAAGLADPLAHLAAPSPSGLTNYGAVTIAGNSVKTLQPGIYSQISIAGNASVTFVPGVYILEAGGFTVSGNAKVTVLSSSPSPITGGGIVIYNTGSKYPNAGGSYGAITLSGNGTVKLSPATIGVYAGIVIDQDPKNTQTLTLSGNGVGLTGIVYAPKAAVVLSGNAQLNASLDVDLLMVSGNAVDNRASPPGGGGASTLTPMPTPPGLSALSAGPAVGAGFRMPLDGTGPTQAQIALPTRGVTGTASVAAPMPSAGQLPVGDNPEAWWLPTGTLEQVAAQDALIAAFAQLATPSRDTH